MLKIDKIKIKRGMIGALVLGGLLFAPALQAKTAVPSGQIGATAQCRDKSYSYSMHRRGTCSHHGGVLKWLKQVPK